MARRPNACQTHVRVTGRRWILCLPPRLARDPHEQGELGRTRLSGIPGPRWHAGAQACAARAAGGYVAQTIATTRPGVNWRESSRAHDLSLLVARLTAARGYFQGRRGGEAPRMSPNIRCASRRRPVSRESAAIAVRST